MQTWPAYFVILIAIAFVLQTALLGAMFFFLRRSHEDMMRVIRDTHEQIKPILSRVNLLVGETQPRLVNMVTDASEVVHIARSQAQKIDRVLTEALDRMRIQLIHADQILTGALETIEDTGSTFRRTLLGPVQQATAVIRGIKTGLDVLRSFRRPSSESSSSSTESADDGMFI